MPDSQTPASATVGPQEVHGLNADLVPESRIPTHRGQPRGARAGANAGLVPDSRITAARRSAPERFVPDRQVPGGSGPAWRFALDYGWMFWL